MKKFQRTFSVLLLILMMGGCGLPPAASVNPGAAGPLVTIPADASPTPTPFLPSGPIIISSPTHPSLPTLTPIAPTLEPSATPSATPPSTNTPIPASPTPAPTFTPLPSGPRTQYLLFAEMDYARKRIDVEYLSAYTNQTGQSLDTLVLDVETNRYSDGFILQAITLNGQTASYRLNNNRLEVTLPEPLGTGANANLGMTYTIYVPQKGSSQVYGYNNSQLNLVDWIPQFVPYQTGSGWQIYDPWPFGEHLTFDAADFEINLKQSDPLADVIVAASTPGEANGEWTRYRLSAARTFAISASPYFLTSTQNAGGIPITSYYFDGYEYGGEAILSYAMQSINLYGSLFAPYPFKSLAIVETHFNDGMEYDGLIFLSRDFYTTYDGTARNNLAVIGIHEIAHQWWYAAVGNNQAMEPWLDEGLSTYTERIYFERNFPADLNWWWNFRVNYFDPIGYVDTTIFIGGAFRTYTNAVYLNGANYLEELRGRIGDEAFFAFLNDYATQMYGRRATADDFFRILRSHTDIDFSDITKRYFLVVR